jgi:hypothetical protein
MTDAEILSIAQEHNTGDLALGRRLGETRSEKNNAYSLKGNIENMELINRAHPEENYQFAWCPFGDNDYFQDCKDEGYKPVIEAEWLSQRWDWLTPEKEKWRWGTTSMLVYRDMFLMYRAQTVWEQEMRNRAQLNDRNIDDRTSNDVEMALRNGVAFEGEVAGKEIKVVPKKTRSVS